MDYPALNGTSVIQPLRLRLREQKRTEEGAARAGARRPRVSFGHDRDAAEEGKPVFFRE